MENITDGHYESLASTHDCLSPGVSSELLGLCYLSGSEPPAVLIQVSLMPGWSCMISWGATCLTLHSSDILFFQIFISCKKAGPVVLELYYVSESPRGLLEIQVSGLEFQNF